MNKDTSGPAFPVSLYAGATYSGHEPFDGMTLRDYFAGQALAGLAANQQWLENVSQANGGDVCTAISVAAYEVADAMLEARSK